MNELRKHRRQRIRRVGKIVAPNGTRPINCIILDVSDGGALLLPETDAMGNTLPVPDAFHLIYRAKKMLYEAVVVRRAVKTLGVRFLSSCDLLTTTDERFAELRQL